MCPSRHLGFPRAHKTRAELLGHRSGERDLLAIPSWRPHALPEARDIAGRVAQALKEASRESTRQKARRIKSDALRIQS